MSTEPRARSLPAGLRLRQLVEADAVALAAVNDEASPAVPITPPEGLARLIALADLALGLERSSRLVGFVIALAPGADYDSENYRFFESRGIDHLYVDRIVIAESERGAGLGPVLYEAVFDAARAAGRAEITCEVNLEPPNPGSQAFHARLGFEQIGVQSTKGGAVTVSLLAAPVSRAE